MKQFFLKYEKAIITISFFAIILILWLVSNEIVRNYNFDGIVEKVTYSIKGIPKVTIKGVEYHLEYNDYHFNNGLIEKGDRLIKKKGEMDLKLIKSNSKDTINFLH
jgi:hypothetical protein